MDYRKCTYKLLKDTDDQLYAVPVEILEPFKVDDADATKTWEQQDGSDVTGQQAHYDPFAKQAETVQFPRKIGNWPGDFLPEPAIPDMPGGSMH